MPWRRSREHDVCPVSGLPIRVAGTRTAIRAAPCVTIDPETRDEVRCEHLGQAFVGRDASVQCRLQGA